MLTRRDNLLIRPWQDRRYNNHRIKVESALPAIDDNPPVQHVHVSCKLKKLQREAERCARIEKDNHTLLQHLSSIMHTTRVDNYWDQAPPSFLHRVGIYPIHIRSSDDSIPTDIGQVPSTRKEKCPACSPHRFKTRERISEERVPWEPPKARLSRRRSSSLADNVKLKKGHGRCDVDVPEFRGQAWPPCPAPHKKSQPAARSAARSIVVSRGALSLSVKVPSHTTVVFNDLGSKKYLQREFCYCVAMPKRQKSNK